VTDANGGIWKYGWDPVNVDQMTTLTDARSIQFLQNFYDSNGRVYKQVQEDSTQYLINYTLDPNNNVTQTQLTDPNGNVRQVTFGPPQLFPDGVFTPGGNTTTDTFALGKPEQQVITYNRDPNTGLLLSVTDSLNRQTALTYDNLGNTTSITNLAGTADAITTSVTYDPQFSQITSITDPLQHKATFGYDSKGNLISAVDPLGNTSSYTRDGQGRVVSVADPLGNAWEFSYNGPDLQTLSDPLGNTGKIATDGGGRIISVTDPLGQATEYAYNSLNRLTRKTDPAGGITAFQYTPNGKLSSVTDARNTSNPTQYTYDNMDRLQKRTDPLGAVEAYSYDPNGNVSCFTDRRGLAAVFSYDGINRTVGGGYGASSCTSSTFQSTTTFTYDGGDRPTGIADSLSGQLTPVFDGLDRVLSVKTPQGSVSYQYDAASRETMMTVAGQAPVNYTYDNANRPTQIVQGGSAVAIGYDIASRRTTLVLPNGISTAYTYDNDSRLTGLAYQGLSVPLGNLIYSYDQDGQVKQVGGSFARTNLPAAVSSATYDAANRLTAWGSNSSFSYDASGNLLGDGTNTYVWDARNQLSSISGGTTASFQYDPPGRRVSKTTAGVTTGFVYDGANVVQELAGATPSAFLLSGGVDEILSRTDTTSRSFLLDGLGSPTALTDPLGTTSTQYTYGPFGSTSVSGSTSSNSFQYAGRENDGTGVFFYRSRYYNPTIGRFISQDPLGFVEGPNFYTYVHDDPTNLTDPSGMGDDAGPWTVGWEWLTGGGPRVHHFTDGDPFTELLRHHQHIQDLINDVCSGTRPPRGRDNYSLGGFGGVPKYLKDYSTLADGGLTGNLAVTYLGSYALTYSETNGVLDIQVYNSSTIESATHPPVIGYMPWWSNNIGKPLNNLLSSGPMSETEQYFDFHENLAGRGCGKQ
jgi:RHS repeat-associated protein